VKDGQIIEEGSHHGLRRLNGRYEEMYTVQTCNDEYIEDSKPAVVSSQELETTLVNDLGRDNNRA
jgi:hypothetical protein